MRRLLSFNLLRVLLVVVLAAGLPVTSGAADYIKQIMLIGGSQSEVTGRMSSLKEEGWTLIDVDLNKGCGSGSDYIYLLYQSESTANNFDWGGYVTDFYISDAAGDIPDEITHNGRVYLLVPFEGGTDFVKSKSDLNRGAGGKTIHLYYTKEAFPDNRAVSNIEIKTGKDNATGAVVWNGTGTPADLNAGCGSGSEYIYMHVTTGTPLPLLSGKGTASNPYLIGSAADWVKFTQMIQDEQCTEQCFKLTADINVSAMAGTSANPFHGTFDGNGKTLSVNISSSEAGAAPFQYINGATIRDLTVTGTVRTSGNHASGLVGLCSGGNNAISGCFVSTNISAQTYAGGLVGHGGSSSLSIADSYYSGTISDFSNFAGGLLGWGDAMTLNMNNCLFKGGFVPSGNGKYHPIACKNSSKTVGAVTKLVFYLNTVSPTAADNYVIPDAQGLPVSQTFDSYHWSVGVIAADGQIYYSAPFTMTPTIGYGNNLTDSPFSRTEDYSLVQQIYTPEEIGYAGAITSISFRKGDFGAFSIEGIKVFMQHTEKNEFETWWMEPINDPFFPAYEGTISSAEGSEWATIILDRPFEYNAKSNLLISVYDPNPGCVTSATFQNHASSFARCCVLTCRDYSYLDDDDDFVIPFDMDLRTGECPGTYRMSGIAINWVNDIQLEISASSLFPRPVDLTVHEVTDQTATIGWKAPSGETGNALTGYACQYKKVGDATWSDETKISATTTSFVLTGLSAFTEYDFRVKAIYGSAESITLSTSFTTLRGTPYEWGFEDGLDGWERVHCNNLASNEQVDWSLYTGIRLQAKHEGNVGFQFYTNDRGPTDPQYLISPRFSGTDPMIVSFYYKSPSAYPETFQVGYSTTTNDIGAFTWGDVVTADYHSQWIYYKRAPFPVGTRYVAIKYISNIARLYIDDICFETYSSYAGPTDLVASDLTDHSAKLSWAKPGNAEGYSYQYKKQNESVWSSEVTVNANTVTLNNLSPNTGYNFRIRALFSGDNASNYVSISFMTEGPVESIPHYQDFENGMGGWRVLTSTDLTGIEEDQGNHYFEFDLGKNPHPDQYLISPRIDASTDLWITFRNRQKSDYVARFKVGYSEQATKEIDTDSWVWSDSFTSDANWQTCTFHLPANTQYVAIRWSAGYWLDVDDISIAPCGDQLTVTKAVFYGEEKYLASFYSKTLNYELPEGSVAYTVAEDGEEMVFLRIGDGDSRGIPAGTPVIIVADKEESDTADTKDILLVMRTDADVSARPGNILQASDTPVAVTDGKIGDKTVYVLGIRDGVPGFYPFAANEIPAGKAYILK